MKSGKLKLGKNLGGPSGKKQSPAIIIIIVLVIAGAGFFVYHNFAGGGSAASDSSVSAPVIPPAGPGSQGPQNGPQGGPSGPTNGAAKPGAQTPSAKPSSPMAAKAKIVKKAEPKKIKMDKMTVFGAIGVSYPDSWKISPSNSNNSAVFTDGKAVLEVIPPDMKAANAKAIATSALKSNAAGGKVTNQGKAKVANSDAYWYAVKVGGQMMRIVGIDSSTRVVLIEHAPEAAFGSYRDTFNQIQDGISMSK